MSETDVASLVSHVREWIAHDPDPETRAEASELLERAQQGDTEAQVALADAFDGRLEFGTAGLRAELGAGPCRMNRVVIAHTTAGFAEFLWRRARAGETSATPSVVIGYDARVNSAIFARDTAEIMAGAGIRATLLPSALPTPVLSFAVRELGVSAGVMVTASHNPPRDNGYKVYLGDADGGSQIAPPVDGVIAALIAEAAQTPCSEVPRSTAYAVADPVIVDAYVDAVATAIKESAAHPRVSADASRNRETASGRHAGAAHPGATATAPDPTIVYTALHGVGSAVARRVFSAAGLPTVLTVAEQDVPDGTFPTVEYPNPEEDGALDLAIALAARHDAAMILANDPDADRLAVAAPHPDEPSGYRRLTGNELGLLLGWRAAERAARLASKNGTLARGTLANTIVSSPALGAVAREYGLDHVETLSGFKWVSRVPNLVFGFEEALGYLSFPSVTRDKDGISAAADALAMARELHETGRTVWDLLDEASERFGHFASSQIVLRLGSAAEVAAVVDRVRADPPARIDGVTVAQARDLLQPGHAAVPANVLAFDLADGSRVMMRPSGTEPKLKIYLDAFCDAGSARERRDTATSALARIERSLRATLEELRS